MKRIFDKPYEYRGMAKVSHVICQDVGGSYRLPTTRAIVSGMWQSCDSFAAIHEGAFGGYSASFQAMAVR